MEYIKARHSKDREIFIYGRVVKVERVEYKNAISFNVLLHFDDGVFECDEDFQLETYTI